MDLRITTLTPSRTPLRNRAMTERIKLRDRAKTIMHKPKPKMLTRRIFPAWALGGNRIQAIEQTSAPSMGEALRTPRPTGPV